jgi:hypothetical protein
MCGCA